MDDLRIIEQLDALIAKGNAIPLRPSADQYISGPKSRLLPGPYAEWRSQSLAFLVSLLTADHPYVREFRDVTEPKLHALTKGLDPFGNHRDPGVGVLRAVAEDVEAGYLTSVRMLVSGEIFTDFLTMAQHLLDEGYHHAAASLAGAVLEDGLRRGLAQRGARTTGNLESMNQVALDKSIYGAIVFTQVKVWISVRNDADHGNWDAVEVDQVRSMIRDLPGFLSTRLGLG